MALTRATGLLLVPTVGCTDYDYEGAMCSESRDWLFWRCMDGLEVRRWGRAAAWRTVSEGLIGAWNEMVDGGSDVGGRGGRT